VNWDSNAATKELAPPNGWVHPFLIYDCRLGDETYAYSLLNVDTAKQKVLDTIDLAPFAR
jgi:hypothetical protein